jgi:hypothetical protein
MSRIKSLAIAAATFAAAMGIGFVMQNQELMAERFGIGDAPSPAPALAPAFALADSSSVAPMLTAPQIESLTGLVAPAAIGPARQTIIGPPVLVADLSGDFLPQVPGTPAVADCTPVMVATSAAAAMAVLDISAPCQPDAFATLHHNGMMFTFATGHDGSAALVVPALTETAIFMAQFADGSVATDQLSVADVALYDRAVLQFEGRTGFELHASEFGADFGAPGHIWRGAAGDALAAADGAGGFMLILGDDRAEHALMAEVYTYPAGAAQQSGEIALSVEAEITAANCGRDLAAQSMQFIGGADPTALDLTLTIPACEGIGDILLLDSMFDTWQVASR